MRLVSLPAPEDMCEYIASVDGLGIVERLTVAALDTVGVFAASRPPVDEGTGWDDTGTDDTAGDDPLSRNRVFGGAALSRAMAPASRPPPKASRDADCARPTEW